MVGLPRSGKSTWIEKNKGDSIVVSHDWIRENILGTHYSSAANAVIWSLADAALRIILSQDKNVILDGLNHTVFVRKFFIDIAKQYSTKVKMVVVNTPLNVCLARNKMAASRKLPDEVLVSISKDLELPTEKEADIIEYYDAVCKHEFKLENMYHDSGYFIQGRCKLCKLDIKDCGLDLKDDDLVNMYKAQQGEYNFEYERKRQSSRVA